MDPANGPSAVSGVVELRLYWMPKSCFNGFGSKIEEDAAPIHTDPGDRIPPIDDAAAGSAIRTRENPAMTANDFDLKHVGTVVSIIGIVVFVLGMAGIFFGS